MTDIASVIGWKFNHQAGVSTKAGKITAFPGGIPSQVDQSAWSMEYQAYLASVAYVGGRIADYKPLAEQLDMLYWDKVNGTDTWKFHIDAVKAANPKPE